jgi:antagonist of KipI
MPIRVNNPGLLTTIQDAGRYGYSHLGISSCGAADSLAYRIANLFLGNEENAPALEMTLLGATLEFKDAVVITLTGADCDCRLEGKVTPMWQAIEVAPGEVYLAIEGGFDVAPVLGSASTDRAGHFGGYQGRKLLKGDLLRIRKPRAAKSRRARRLQTNALDTLYPRRPIRVTRGTQQDLFDREAFEKLFSRAYVVSDDSDRSGLRLKGEAIRPPNASQLITDGIPLGAIQVPQDGQPIILFVDQQTTGGYPKIANVIAADMHRVGQLRPRDSVRFAEVTMAEAIESLRQQEEWLKTIFVS